MGHSWDDSDETEPMLHFHRVEALPEDAVRLGLDRNTQEGAMLAMAGSLDGGTSSHRIVAWVVLLSLTLPLLLTLMYGFL